MLKVNFYIRTQKVNKNGECPILAKISYRQKQVVMVTGKSISAERWESTNRLKNTLKIEKERVIKSSLDTFLLTLEKKFNELARIDPDVSLSLLKKEITGKTRLKTSTISILEIMEKHNTYFKKKVDAGDRASASLQKYERAKVLLKNFMIKQYAIDDIDVTEINSGFIYNLESFLTYESNFKGHIGIKNNSVVKYMKVYKTACNYSIKMDLINKNPFNLYTGKLNNKDGVFLTQQELNRIEKKKFNTPRLERVKDIFLFSCYTGYAPVDACSLTVKNLIEGNNNELWIMTNRTKTTIKANVPVLPPILKIIKKYEGQQEGLIPKLSNQKMNAYLKEIADICKIDKNLTWYVARHTFATTVTLGNGMRIENVSAMMGHTNIKQTQHYAKVLDQNVMEDMAKVFQKYNS